MLGGLPGKSPSEYKHYAEKNPEAFRRFVSKNLPNGEEAHAITCYSPQEFLEKYQEGA